jgi:hypothetical protein
MGVRYNYLPELFREIEHRLGYAKHAPEGNSSGNLFDLTDIVSF